jgi:hypothetical protein
LRTVSVRLSHHARRTGTVAATAAFLVAGLATHAFAADPAGNNGTIKIDSKPFDDSPNNEPHVGCRLQVAFYGYDLGNCYADVTFSVQPPPSGKFDVVETDSVFVGEGAAGGGTDLDASRTYSLSPALGGYAVNPQQGFISRSR